MMDHDLIIFNRDRINLKLGMHKISFLQLGYDAQTSIHFFLMKEAGRLRYIERHFRDQSKIYTSLFNFIVQEAYMI